MRIHFIVRTINEKTGGGSHHNALVYIRFLIKQGHEVTVHAFAKNGTEAPADISVQIHEYGAGSFEEANTDLVTLLKADEHNADVFFLYGVDFLWGGGRYRKEGGSVPVSVYLDTYLPSMALGARDGVSFFGRNMYRLKRTLWEKTIGIRIHSFVDRYVAVSPFLRDEYIRYGFPSERFVVVPNAFIFPEEVLKPQHEGIKMLYAGRIIHDKGVDLLISALSTCIDLEWTLTIVGSGPLLESCESLVTSAGLEKRITFIPWVDSKELSSLYQNADIFVHPARWPEPFGRTLVEAMWHSNALIVPSRGAAPWVAEGATCVFTNGNQKDLETEVRKLLTDSDLRKGLSSSGPARAKTFEVKNVGLQLEDLLCSILET